MNIIKDSLHLYADAKAVITQFLFLSQEKRIFNMINRVENLSANEADECLQILTKDFAARHRDLDQTLLNHFQKIEEQNGINLSRFTVAKKLLLGAFFTKEYSIQAAALFNPSIVPHPDQQGLKSGQQRFIMSLRATGEGHISSIIFKTGIADENARITLDSSSGYFICLQKKIDTRYSRDFIRSRAVLFKDFDFSVVDSLPEHFSEAEALSLLKSATVKTNVATNSISQIEKIWDANYNLISSSQIPINEKVIFPVARIESMGMEDVRFVKFSDNGIAIYYGTYTAYDGHQIQSQLIETSDFNEFKIRSLYGEAVSDKGMALFPEKINGRYVMVSRQGGENISIMFSENIYEWKSYQLLMEPYYPWELLQSGNCGSPVKTERGWLLLIHGVGLMRTYVISAILLDLHDPTQIIGRLDKPLIQADQAEREGYVPNVVYTCGSMLHNKTLVIPYAVSDSATAFATIGLEEILNEMKPAP
ncbi:MAG: glycosidase [Chitinophagales bacterium]|nr:glycosidase [Chitinophagales bacterium]